MSLPDLGRRSLLAALALAGCGFTPAYAPGGPGSRLRGRVALRAPTDLNEAALADALRLRLGAEGAAYMLDYTLVAASLPQITAADSSALRTELVASADYRLTDGARTVASGRVSASASFAAAGTPVATLASDAAARERLAAMLADQIVARLLAALA